MSPKFGDIACSQQGKNFRYDVKLMYLGPAGEFGKAWYLVLEDADPHGGWPVGRVVDGWTRALRSWTWIDGNAPVT